MHDGKQDRNAVVDYEKVMQCVFVFEGEHCMQRYCHPHCVYCCINLLSLRENTAYCQLNYNVTSCELTSPGPGSHFNWEYLNDAFFLPKPVI